MNLTFLLDDGIGNKYQVRTTEALRILYEDIRNKKKAHVYVCKDGLPWYEALPEIEKRLVLRPKKGASHEDI